MVLVGLYYCFKNLSDRNIFVILYGLTSIYFAGVMVRLMLVLAPIMCILGGIAVSGILSNYIPNMDLFDTKQENKTLSNNTKKDVSKNVKKQKDDNYPYKNQVFLIYIKI